MAFSLRVSASSLSYFPNREDTYERAGDRGQKCRPSCNGGRFGVGEGLSFADAPPIATRTRFSFAHFVNSELPSVAADERCWGAGAQRGGWGGAGGKGDRGRVGAGGKRGGRTGQPGGESKGAAASRLKQDRQARRQITHLMAGALETLAIIQQRRRPCTSVDCLPTCGPPSCSSSPTRTSFT